MKQEDKELLLRDLCGRLPYGVKGMLCEDCICTLDKIWTKKGYELVVFAGDYYDVDCFKPYLYPLSSMTKEQKRELHNIQGVLTVDFELEEYKMVHLFQSQNTIDWLNKNHFDYRGLIEAGLAIDATGLNIYKEETK